MNPRDLGAAEVGVWGLAPSGGPGGTPRRCELGQRLKVRRSGSARKRRSYCRVAASFNEPVAQQSSLSGDHSPFPALVHIPRSSDSDDARSEIGAFAKLYFEKIRATVPALELPHFRLKAIARAKHIAKYGGTSDSPGAVFTSVVKDMLAGGARASPSRGVKSR